MGRQSVVTHSPEETIELGRQIARQLTPPVVVLLIGELGAGKTTLTKGLVAGRSEERRVGKECRL